jgi:tetratricopeptide (TPR) repeat protein
VLAGSDDGKKTTPRANTCTPQQCLADEPLLAAIESFRTALSTDPGFGLASYRLGTALHAAHHRDVKLSREATQHRQQAVIGLQESLKHNPELTAASLELAAVLADADERKADEHKEAHDICQKVTTAANARLLDRATAASMLCQERADESQAADGATSSGEADQAARAEPYVAFNISYFYCKVAEHMYALATSPDNAPSIQPKLAAVYNSLGDSLLEQGGGKMLVQDAVAHCRTGRGLLPDVWPMRQELDRNGRYSAAALRYYDRALVLASDDGAIGCHAQAVVVALRQLRADEEPHQPSPRVASR